MAVPTPPHPRRTQALAPRHDPDAAVWEPCPTCWGQRRILAPAANGEGLVHGVCPQCLGVGERMAPERCSRRTAGGARPL